MSDLQSTEIVILGQKFTLRGHSDPEYMQELAAQLDARMREVSESRPGSPLHRVAIQTALVLLDELTRQRRVLDQDRQRFDQAARGAAQLDLRLQQLLQAPGSPAPAAGRLHVEESSEVLDFNATGEAPDR